MTQSHISRKLVVQGVMVHLPWHFYCSSQVLVDMLNIASWNMQQTHLNVGEIVFLSILIGILI